MRLRTMLAATAVTALVLGTTGVSAHSAIPSSPVGAGALVTWGDETAASGGDAMVVPGDLTGPVRSVAADAKATGVVTLDGRVRVWGSPSAPEVDGAPVGVTDATAITLASNEGAILRSDGSITAWGNSTLADVPTDLRAKAIALQGDTGYAVRPDGTLATWGDAPAYPLPGSDLTDLVDVVASPIHALALHADGTVTTWGNPGISGLLDVPDFGGHHAVQVAAGPAYSGAVLEDGTIRLWGPGAPAGAPSFDGASPEGRVVNLNLASNAAAVTADGAVQVWGPTLAVKDVPGSLTGKPVSAVALGQNHAVAVVTTFRDLTQPVVSGTAIVGQTLTATFATFSLTPDTATGQWYADNDPIAGKTGTILTLDGSLAGKSISYRTTGTRGASTVTSTSTAVGPVARATSSVVVTVSPASASAGSTRTATATVTSPVTSTVGIATGTVTFKQGATTATVRLAGAKATWTLPTLSAGTRSVTATYNGDPNLAPSTATSATLTVTKAISAVSEKAKVVGKPAKTGKVAKKVTITVSVRSAKGISPAGKVTVALKGATKKTVTGTVNAAGKVTVTFKNVKRGKYTAKIAYAGNANVVGSTGSVKFKI